jgi:hypothetical protein
MEAQLIGDLLVNRLETSDKNKNVDEYSKKKSNSRRCKN